MAYEGDIMLACPPVPFNFSQTYAVVVSGDFPNPCGHMILNLGGIGAWYFHVAGVHTFPRYMNEAGYRRYLRDTGKREIRRQRVLLTNPSGAMLKLEELLSARWIWGVLPHNCASFVEDIVEAGGSDAGLYTNCPELENFD